jgi:hypothetical protein
MLAYCDGRLRPPPSGVRSVALATTIIGHRLLGRHRCGYLHPVPPRSLRGVDGCVGLGDQVLSPHAQSIAGCNSDAARQADRRTEPFHSHIRHPVTNALRDRACGRDVRAAEDDYEFLAAVPSDDVGLPQFGLNRPDDCVQAGVARWMPEGVVDLLEMIEVDEQQRYGETARAGAQAGGVQSLNE